MNGIIGALTGTKDALYTYPSVIEASTDQLAALILDVSPGKVSETNAFLLEDGSDIEITGGPEHYVAHYAKWGGKPITVDVDRANRTFAIQGGWWHRGIYSIEQHPKGTLLTQRVYNVATSARFAVAFIQFGKEADLSKRFDGELARLGRRLGCKAYQIKA